MSNENFDSSIYLVESISMQIFDLALLLVMIYVLENFKTTMKCVKNCVLRKKKAKPQKVYKKAAKKFEHDIDDDDV